MLSTQVLNTIARVLNTSEGDVVKALEGFEKVNDIIESKIRGRWMPGALSPDKRPILYAIIRLLKPMHAVETGVGAGVSTTVILGALNANNHGHLYSIEISPTYYDEESNEYPVGFIVPEEFKGRWTLMLGSSRDLLERILNELGEIQFFLHDSDHSYDNVLFELKTVWRYMRRGVILVDNYRFSGAAKVFASSVNAPLIELSRHAGGLALIPVNKS